MQSKITHHQTLYRQWLALYHANEALIQNLSRQSELCDELSVFYFGQDDKSTWQEFYEQIENGADVDLTTDGEYSVMNQDTLWDMVCDERAFYENLLQIAQNRLNKLNQS